MARLGFNFGRKRGARNHPHPNPRAPTKGHAIAVVVSPMSGGTNELVGWCRAASPLHDAREYDVVVASGEQVTSGLLALALQDLGVSARSWSGRAVRTPSAR